MKISSFFIDFIMSLIYIIYNLYKEELMKIKYDEVIIFKISKDLKEKMESKAYEKGQTVSDYLRGLIVKDVKE